MWIAEKLPLAQSTYVGKNLNEVKSLQKKKQVYLMLLKTKISNLLNKTFFFLTK